MALQMLHCGQAYGFCQQNSMASEQNPVRMEPSKLGVVVHACDPSTQEAEAGGS
jgi:hypothetical protein